MHSSLETSRNILERTIVGAQLRRWRLGSNGIASSVGACSWVQFTVHCGTTTLANGATLARATCDHQFGHSLHSRLDLQGVVACVRSPLGACAVPVFHPRKPRSEKQPPACILLAQRGMEKKEPVEWVPAQHKQPEILDHRFAQVSQKGFKERCKRRREEEYAQAEADVLEQEQRMDADEPMEEDQPSAKRQQGEGMKVIPVRAGVRRHLWHVACTPGFTLHGHATGPDGMEPCAGCAAA